MEKLIGRTDKFFRDLAIQLRDKGFSPLPVEEGHLPVEKDGKRICNISVNGWVKYDPGGGQLDELCHEVKEIAQSVREYMDLMEYAPEMTVSGLEKGHKRLAEFNSVVLAGQDTKHGVQFVTWVEDDYRDSVHWGHYFGSNYERAKKDFATRTGLIPEDRLFFDEQLTEMYRCVKDILDMDLPIADKRAELLEKVCEQIERSVPDLDERVGQSQDLDGEVADQFEFGQTMY